MLQMLYSTDESSCNHPGWVGPGAGPDICKTDRPLALARYRPRFLGKPASSLVTIPIEISLPHDECHTHRKLVPILDPWKVGSGKLGEKALSTFLLYSQPTVTAHSSPSGLRQSAQRACH